MFRENPRRRRRQIQLSCTASRRLQEFPKELFSLDGKQGVSAWNAIVLLVMITASCTNSSPVTPAETVIRNGTIYTANDKQPRAEAIAVSGGKILFVGFECERCALHGAG